MSTVVGYLVGERGEFSGLRVAIPEKGLIIGRDPKQADLVVDHLMVSRRHAQIAPANDGKLYLIDLQSQNGTHVNGRKINAPVALNAGDKIDFGGEGQVLFTFESAEPESITGILKQVFGEKAARVEWQPGDTILDLYEVKKVLGQGGMGKVYLVHHKSWNIDLAVKSPLPGLFSEEKAAENFIREAETWVNLNLHPNIVQCYYVRTIGGIPRIFTEYVAGGSLHHWIAQKKLTQLDQILDVAIQFAWGLHASHEQGIVHQDVKPHNVLMTPDGTAKVSDFGLARSRPATEGNVTTTAGNLVTMAGLFTQAYCSPEQTRGERLSRKTDIWSWAVSVLHMFVGEIVWKNGLQAPQVLDAYQGFFGPKFAVKMPKRFANLLARCFKIRPENRPSDMLAIANELQAVYHEACGEQYPRTEPRAVEHLADSLNNRAVSLLDLGKREEASKLWRQALQIEPHHPESTYNLGLVLWRLAEVTDDALVRSLCEVRRSHPYSLRVALPLAWVHAERGDVKATEQELRDFDRQDAPELDACKLLGELRICESQSRGVIASFQSRPPAIVTAACISGDGQHILSATLTKKLYLSDVRSNRVLSECSTGPLSAIGVALTPDCRYALTRNQDGSVTLWNLESKLSTAVWEQPTAPPDTTALLGHGPSLMCLSGNGRWALWVTADGTMRVVEIPVANEQVTLECHSGKPTAIAVSHDGRFAVSGNADGTISLWDVRRGRAIQHLNDGSGYVRSVSVSQAGSLIAFAADSGTMHVWNAGSRRVIRTFKGHVGGVRFLSFIQSERAVLSTGEDNTVRLWHASTGRCLYTFSDHPTGLGDLTVTADGMYCLVASSRQQTLLRLRLTGQVFVAPYAVSRPLQSRSLGQVEREYDRLVRLAAESANAQDFAGSVWFIRQARTLPGCARRPDVLAAWVSLYGRTSKCGLSSGWEQKSLTGHECPVLQVRVSPDGRVIVSGDENGHLRIWDASSGECMQVLKGHGAFLSSLALTPDALHLYSAAGSFESCIRLWDLRSGNTVAKFRTDQHGASCLALTPDSHYLLSGNRTGTVALWDATTGRCIRAIQVHNGDVDAIFVSTDGLYVISVGRNERVLDFDGGVTVKLWELSSGRCVRVLKADRNPDSPAHWHEQKTGDTNDIPANARSFWEFFSGFWLAAVPDHRGNPTATEFLADGRHAVSTDGEATIRIWDVAERRCLRVFEGHSGGVTSVSVAAHGELVVSGGDDGFVRIWLLDWDLEGRKPTDWDEGARPRLETFLSLQTPYAAELPKDRQPTDEEITLALTRHGKPVWNEKDFERLLYTLGCAGYGWLRPDGVRRELLNMTGVKR